MRIPAAELRKLDALLDPHVRAIVRATGLPAADVAEQLATRDVTHPGRARGMSARGRPSAAGHRAGS